MDYFRKTKSQRKNLRISVVFAHFWVVLDSISVVPGKVANHPATIDKKGHQILPKSALFSPIFEQLFFRMRHLLRQDFGFLPI